MTRKISDWAVISTGYIAGIINLYAYVKFDMPEVLGSAIGIFIVAIFFTVRTLRRK